MELYASTVIVEGDGKLTIYDKTQGVQNVQRYVCSVLDIDRAMYASCHSLWRRLRLGASPAI